MKTKAIPQFAERLIEVMDRYVGRQLITPPTLHRLGLEVGDVLSTESPHRLHVSVIENKYDLNALIVQPWYLAEQESKHADFVSVLVRRYRVSKKDKSAIEDEVPMLLRKGELKPTIGMDDLFFTQLTNPATDQVFYTDVPEHLQPQTHAG